MCDANTRFSGWLRCFKQRFTCTVDQVVPRLRKKAKVKLRSGASESKTCLVYSDLLNDREMVRK